MSQRLQVAPACAEAAFRGLLVAHASLEVFTQQLKALACRLGTQADGDMTILTDVQGNRFARQVSLVTDQRHFGRVWPGFEEFRPQRKRIKRFRGDRKSTRLNSS